MSDKEIFNLFLDELYKIPIGAHGILIGMNKKTEASIKKQATGYTELETPDQDE